MDEIGSIEDIQRLALRGNRDWKQYGDVGVKVQGDLLIFNYTVQAQFKAAWNFFERVSRGLILNFRTGEVAARPFDKFYNWLEGGRRANGHIVVVTEKVDGSLGILYRTAGEYRIAMRGSFTSAQALWATQFLGNHFDLTGLSDVLTLLFEIVYPDNRVILDYQGREDLVLLAARNRHTGDYLPFFPDVQEIAARYGFSLPRVLAFNNLAQIFERTGALGVEEEGYVVEFSDGSRFKFKGDRYLELQKLVTGLTYKNVLRAMSNNALDTVLHTIPDEFLVETRGWIASIQTALAETKGAVESTFAQAPKASRKDFALWIHANAQDLSSYLFAMLDERAIEPLIYKALLDQAPSSLSTMADDGA